VADPGFMVLRVCRDNGNSEMSFAEEMKWTRAFLVMADTLPNFLSITCMLTVASRTISLPRGKSGKMRLGGKS
jgi:hypothetical protein